MHDLIAVSAESQLKSGKIEISVRGRWVDAPARWVNGQAIVITGKRIKIATLHDEDWLEEELHDPGICVRELKECTEPPRADILCFSQKVPETAPRFEFPMEMRSIAVAEVGIFKDWWEKLPQETRKNVRRSQKRGVEIRVKGFDADVIRGIANVQNEMPVRQGRPYIHYGKSFEQVQRDHGAFVDRSDFSVPTSRMS